MLWRVLSPVTRLVRRPGLCSSMDTRVHVVARLWTLSHSLTLILLLEGEVPAEAFL